MKELVRGRLLAHTGTAMDLRAMTVVAAAIVVQRLAPGERAAHAIGALVAGTGLFLIAPAVIARAAGLG